MADESKLEKDIFAFLKNPDMFKLITETEFDKTIVGEVKTRKAIFLTGCITWVDKKNMNTIVGGESSIGKDHILEAVMNIFPSNNTISRTRISPKAFTYWKQDWTNINLCLVDIADSVLNDEVFKVMCSNGSKTSVVKNQKVIHIEIIGKPSIFVTTAEAEPSNEILNRFNLISLDESKKQTKEIKDFIAKDYVDTYNSTIKKALCFLKPVKVVVPFADKMTSYFPDIVKMRRVFTNFMNLVKASTALHQFQREKDDKGKFIATEQDYLIAREVIESIRDSTITGITASENKYFEKFKEIKEESWLTAREIHDKTKYMSIVMWWKVLNSLEEKGLILSKDGVRVESFKPITEYIVKKEETSKLALPEYKQLLETN